MVFLWVCKITIWFLLFFNSFNWFVCMCIHVCVCYTQTEMVLRIFWISTRSDVISVGCIASVITWMTSLCHNRNKNCLFNACFACWHFKLLCVILEMKLAEEKPLRHRIFLWIFSIWAKSCFSPIAPVFGVIPITPQWVTDTINGVEATGIACVHDCPLLWVTVVICHLMHFTSESTKKTTCCGHTILCASSWLQFVFECDWM